MSFACDHCNKSVPAPKGRDWPTRCPWCGGPVIYVGLISTSGTKSQQAPITLSRAKQAPARRAVPTREWIAAAAVVGVLLAVLLGISWFLVAHAGDKRPQAEAAAGEKPTGVRLEPAPVVAVVEPRRVDPVLPPIGQERPVPNQAEELPLPAVVNPPQDPPVGVAAVAVAEEEVLPRPAPVVEVAVMQQPQPQQPLRPAPQNPGSLSATFMGVKAIGKRICIIADCSGSMAFNNRMVRLKKELANTLKALSPEQEFYVIYFSTDPIPMPARSWRHGGKDVKKILPWIGGQPAGGGTEPLPAFELAFRLKPKPDVIFFLTDGIIPTTVPAAVAKLNAKARTPINTILFGGELATTDARVEMVPVRQGRKIVMVPRKRLVPKMEKDEGQLQQIARDSGGTHRFVPDIGKGDDKR
jgi:hypothetical protein